MRQRLITDAAFSRSVSCVARPNLPQRARRLWRSEGARACGLRPATYDTLREDALNLAAVYNEKVDYTGIGASTPVMPGPKTAVKMSFSDAQRFGG